MILQTTILLRNILTRKNALFNVFILKEDVYQPFIEVGKLKSITTAQFFRKSLNAKKIAHNLVHRDLGDE